jgi:hypothetical protein
MRNFHTGLPAPVRQYSVESSEPNRMRSPAKFAPEPMRPPVSNFQRGLPVAASTQCRKPSPSPA